MLLNTSDQLVVRPRPVPGMRLAVVTIAVVTAVALTAGAYWLGSSQYQERARLAEEQLARLRQTHEELEQRSRALRTSLTQVERQLQIDKTAYAELSAVVQLSNTQLNDLRNELRFYRSILSPEDGKSGLRIHEFSITPTEQTDRFSYKLILIQALKHDTEVGGTVSFEIRGLENGDAKTIRRPEPGDEPIEVKFKYFQNLDGVLALPPAFVPSEITVSVHTGKKDSDKTERSYPWPRTEAPGSGGPPPQVGYN